MNNAIETLSAFSIFALLILFASPISNLTRIPVVVVEMILGALTAQILKKLILLQKLVFYF